MKVTFEAAGLHPVDDRRGKGFECRFDDRRTGASVTVFVQGDDSKTAQVTAVDALKEAAERISAFKGS